MSKICYDPRHEVSCLAEDCQACREECDRKYWKDENEPEHVLQREIFTLLEMEEYDVKKCRTTDNRQTADGWFDTLAEESQLAETDDLIKECRGTIRMAGDDVYAIQLVRTELE